MLSSFPLLPLAAAGSTLLAIVGIGFLIFVHEFGHYLACRLTKTRVETFSIGFGTRLFGWEKKPGEPRRFTLGRRQLDPADHAMDFRIALVPLGGYVKMAGENPGEARTGAGDEFPSKPTWARVFIVSAGVLMNLVTAFAFYWIAFANHIEQEPAVVGLAEPGGPAWEAGIRPGDRIEAIDGTRVRSFLDLKTETVFLPAGHRVPLEVKRDGETKRVQVEPRYDEDLGAVLLRVQPALVLSIGGKDETWTIGPFDRVKVDGVPATGGSDVLSRIQLVLQAGESSTVTLERPSGERWDLEWKPGPPGEGEPPRRIGVAQRAKPIVKDVRGKAASVLRPGDHVVAALRGSEKMEIPGAFELLRLPYHVPVDHLVVVRDDTTLEVPVPGDTRAHLAEWLDDISLERSHDTAVEPIPPGAISQDGDTFYRYVTIPSVEAGIHAGDRIVSIDGRAMDAWKDVTAAIRAALPGHALEVGVKGPDGRERTLSITPAPLEPLVGPKLEAKSYTEPYPSEGVLDSAGLALGRAGREVENVFRLIGAFFKGNLSFRKNVGGPVTIVQVSSQQAQLDWLRFLTFLAYISVTLAVLNILPIPILDGGWLLFIVIEKVKGSPLKEETQGKLQFVGLILLLVLMFFAFANDFRHLAK